MSRLLREYVDFQYDRKIVQEAIEGHRSILVTALLQRADAVNQNKRIYPRAILQREVENYKKAVQENRATGELDHPDSSIVELSNVSHVIREVYWNGDEVFGKVEVLDTPKGKIVQDLMKAGIRLGISSRGVGDTIKNSEGFDVVDESFMLVAWDIVSEPSTHNAWLMSESREIPLDRVRQMIPKVDRINRIANEILRG